MKVLLITPGLLPVPPIKGGAVEYLIDLYLKDNNIKDEISYTIYTIGEEKEYYEYQNCKFIFINTNGILYKIDRAIRYILNKILKKIYISNAFIKKVMKKLKNDSTDYDIVIVENNPLYILKLKKYYKGKIILHLHNDYLNEKTKCSKEILDTCKKVITISDYLKKQVETIYHTKKIETVYNGIDIERFFYKITDKEKEKLREKYNVKKDDILFLYTGRLIKEKGIYELKATINS